MMNGKTNLSIFVVIALVVGVVFSVQASKINQEVDKLAFDSVVQKTGEVAGAYQAKGAVTLSVNDGKSEKKFEVNTQAGMNVLSVLQKAQEEGNLTLVTDKQDFGVLVEELNGLKGGTDGKYWMYYVNGEAPVVGVDAYELKVGDLVEFKFEKF